MQRQNVYHFSQYVEKLIADRKLPLNHEFKAKVTYHDPCHMGRHMGVFDAPRNVLKKIKGIELVEMDRTRENSRCCGAGGGYKSQYNDMAVNIAAERIRDAEETGAEILVTCCPFCVVNLTQGAKQIGSKIKIMDLSEVLMHVTAPVEDKTVEETKPEPPQAKAAEPACTIEVTVVKEEVVIIAEPQSPVQQKEGKPEPVEEKKVEKPKAAAVSSDKEDDEEAGDDVWTDNSPEALVRRAAWNKGLRCRRDYGEHNIPVAFVKPKVAVYILTEGTVDAKTKASLEEDDWIVLSFLESDITDGEAQALDIRTAVKENLKTLGKKKRR